MVFSFKPLLNPNLGSNLAKLLTLNFLHKTAFTVRLLSIKLFNSLFFGAFADKQLSVLFGYYVAVQTL